MSAPQTVTEAFTAWAHSEVASHYAAPAPDDVMDQLVDDTHARLETLIAIPATSCDELVLKIFPVLLANFEPRAGDDPMLPRHDPKYDNQETLFSVILDDLRRLSPTLATVMSIPHRDRASSLNVAPRAVMAEVRRSGGMEARA